MANQQCTSFQLSSNGNGKLVNELDDMKPKGKKMKIGDSTVSIYNKTLEQNKNNNSNKEQNNLLYEDKKLDVEKVLIIKEIDSGICKKEEIQKDKIEENLINCNIQDLYKYYDNGETDLKKILKTMEIFDVVGFVNKENWSIVLEKLQDPEIGYQVFQNIVFQAMCDHMVNGDNNSIKSTCQLFKRREYQWKLKFQYLFKHFKSIKKSEEIKTEITPIQKETPNEKLPKQTLNSATIQNNSYITKKIPKNPIQKSNIGSICSKSNTSNNIQENPCFPVEIQHLHDIACYSIPKEPLIDLTSDDECDITNIISSNIPQIIKPVSKAKPILSLPELPSNETLYRQLKNYPPKPILKVSVKMPLDRNDTSTNVILNWEFIANHKLYTTIKCYEIFIHNMNHTNLNDNSSVWNLLDSVLPLPLPMSCIIQMVLKRNHSYYFIIRAKDIFGSYGDFSEVQYLNII